MASSDRHAHFIKAGSHTVSWFAVENDLYGSVEIEVEDAYFCHSSGVDGVLEELLEPFIIPSIFQIEY